MSDKKPHSHAHNNAGTFFEGAGYGIGASMETVETLFGGGNVILPSQQSKRFKILEAEQRLCLAILEDAINSISIRRRHYEDDIVWLMGKGRPPFSAEICCDALGINYDALRERVARGGVLSLKRRSPVMRFIGDGAIRPDRERSRGRHGVRTHTPVHTAG